MVDERLAELRDRAKSEPATARDDTWAWFRDLGKRRAVDELDQLFAKGDTPQGLDGPTDGMLVMTQIHPAADPLIRDTKVLVIDYAPLDQNPDRLIRKIRDELVEIVPGANLGKVLHRRADGGYRNWGFFALKPAA